MKENGIQLKIHKFETEDLLKEKMLFTTVNNRQLDMKTSGITKLKTILSTVYDNVEHSVSTTLRHKIVYNEIINMSGKTSSYKEQNERFSSKNFFKKKNSISETEEFNCKQPFIHFSHLKNNLLEKKNMDEISFDASKDLEKVLVDLHKLGLIIYFDNSHLRNIIISEPQWFNNVFKVILDHGRQGIEILMENILIDLSTQSTKNKKQKTLKKKLKEHLGWLKGKTGKKVRVEEIWESNELRYISNVDKISFDTLLRLIDQVEKSLLLLEKEDLLNKENQSLPITQTFYTINEEQLQNEIIKKLLQNLNKSTTEEKKIFEEIKNFIVNLLAQYDLIIPKKKQNLIKYGDQFIKKRVFIVPLLFPFLKPTDLKFNSTPLSKMKFSNFWEIVYFFPFKPSSLWKMIFLRIRRACVGSETSREMSDELYWMDGFYFYFCDKKNKEIDSLIELEFDSETNNNNNNNNPNSTNINVNVDNVTTTVHFNNPNTNNTTSNLTSNLTVGNNSKYKELMKVRIKSNEPNIQLLFFSIHHSVQEFIQKWIVSNVTKKINVQLLKFKTDSDDMNDSSLLTSRPLISQTLSEQQEDLDIQISSSLSLLPKKKNALNSSDNQNSTQVNCAFCGLTFSVDDNLIECDKCDFILFYFFFYSIFLFNFFFYSIFYFLFNFYYLYFFRCIKGLFL